MGASPLSLALLVVPIVLYVFWLLVITCTVVTLGRVILAADRVVSFLSSYWKKRVTLVEPGDMVHFCVVLTVVWRCTWSLLLDLLSLLS